MSQNSDTELQLFNKSSFTEIFRDLDPEATNVINAALDGGLSSTASLASSQEIQPIVEPSIPTTVLEEKYEPVDQLLPQCRYQSQQPEIQLPDKPDHITYATQPHSPLYYVIPPAVVSPPPSGEGSPASATYSPDIYVSRPHQTVSLQRQTSEGIFEGQLKFCVEIPVQEKITKSTPWIFSDKLNRLYIQMGVQAVVRFRVSHLVGGLFVRAIPMYIDHHWRADPVTSCQVHIDRHMTSGLPCGGRSSSWIRTSSRTAGAEILQDPVGHFTLKVPWFVSETTLEINYSFSCRNTCVGGPNRRRTAVAFTLENDNGEVLGKKVIEVKVVSSPGRDKEKDENKLMVENNPIETTDGSSSCKKRTRDKKVTFSSSPPKKYKHYLGMNAQLTYNLLQPLRDSLEFMSKLPPEAIEKYRESNCHLKSALRVRTEPTSTITTAPQNTSKLTSRILKSPTEQPDSSGRIPSPEDRTNHDTNLAAWLSTFGYEAYADTFSKAGYHTLQQIMDFTIKDIDKLRIASASGRIILNHLSEYSRGEPLSQPSNSAEVFGLITQGPCTHVNKKSQAYELNMSSSED